jgi:hypothetical protein
MKMKKLIMIIAIMFAMFTLSATPKFTLLDYNAGNTPEYVNKILKDNDLERFSVPFTDKIGNYVRLFSHGTWLIEEDGQAAVISIYKGKPIYGTSVLINYGKEEN